MNRQKAIDTFQHYIDHHLGKCAVEPEKPEMLSALKFGIEVLKDNIV